ncbi:MAG: hypothetical protein HQ483_15510 [Rhodospirillales bacterium]|nr:hypothetical protein [Rhodospirillales bacterium]
MGGLSVVLVIVAALLADLGVEISAEITADSLLDGDAGAIVAMRPAAPSAIVDMSPASSLNWPQ